MSSFRNIPVDAGYVLVGEVGLTGEVRAVSQIDKRISEAMRLGFKNIIIPEGNKKLAGQIKTRGGFGVIAVSNIQQALEIIFRDVWVRGRIPGCVSQGLHFGMFESEAALRVA